MRPAAVSIAVCRSGSIRASASSISARSTRGRSGRPPPKRWLAACRAASQEPYLRQAAWKLDTGAPDASKFCAMAKKQVTEVGSRVADQCLQLHGGYGYLADYGIEKIVRDLRVHQILEGTNEIMRLITARHLIG